MTNILLYIAAALLPLDNFPFMFGGAYKPVSLLFIALYFACNIPALIRMPFQRKEVWIFVILLSAVAMTIFGNLQHSYSFVGLTDAFVSLGAGIVIYLSYRLFVYNNDRLEALVKLFRWLLRGYWLAALIGMAQVVYIYAVHSGALSDLIGLFVQRAPYITAGRVHFTFSEPSFIGLHTSLLLFPAYMFLKKHNRLTGSDRALFFIFLPLSLLSLSLRYYLDLLAFAALYLLVTFRPRAFANRGIAVLLAGGAALLVVHAVLVGNLFKLQSDHYYRMLNIYNDPASIAQDGSFSIRSTYSMIGVYAFLDKPLLGYGVGNYYYGYMNNLDRIPAKTYRDNEELRAATSNPSLPQYNMYTRLISEFGVVGIVLLGLFLSLMGFRKRGSFSRLIVLLLLYALLQFDSFAFIQLLLWLALLRSPHISTLEIGSAEPSEARPACRGALYGQGGAAAAGAAWSRTYQWREGDDSEENMRHRTVPSPGPWIVQGAGDDDQVQAVQREIRFDRRGYQG